MSVSGSLGRLLRDQRGAMAIEMAVVTPLLAMIAIGTFEVGVMVSRQQELQSAASEAESIILAASAGTGTNSATIEEVIEESLGLQAAQVSLEQRFRCDTQDDLSTSASDCDTSAPIYRYILLQVNDSYRPVWARFGVSSAFDYQLERTIQVG